MLKGFKEMSKIEQENTYGGFAWLVAMIPLLLQSIVTTTASIKSIFSDKGSLKGKDISATWDNKVVNTTSKGKSSTHAQTVNYFAY